MKGLTFAAVAKSADTSDRLTAFCRRLGELTGLDVAPLVLPSHADLLRSVVAGAVDLAWAPPLVALELEDSHDATLLVLVKRSYSAGYHSALFTRADSGLGSLEQLAGASVAWVSPMSASGYFAPRWQLGAQGIDLARAIGHERFYANHEAVARAVWAREVELGANHVQLDPLSGRLASAPWQQVVQDPSAIRVLLLVGPIPGDVIVAGRTVAAEVKRQVTAALLAFCLDDPGMRSLFDATSFEPTPEGHLALLRRLARFARGERAG